jgi:hypothetical protein
MAREGLMDDCGYNFDVDEDSYNSGFKDGFLMAIDEFAEKLCDVFSEEYGEVTVNGIKFDVLTLDGATEIIWEVAEQLKEE